MSESEPLQNNIDLPNRGELLFIHESAIEEVNTKLKILNNEFKVFHDHNPIEDIKTRVKKPDQQMLDIKKELDQYAGKA